MTFFVEYSIRWGYSKDSIRKLLSCDRICLRRIVQLGPMGQSRKLHELPFCVGQDSPLKLPYSHIACKGISPLHELLLCVWQETPLKLPYGHIARKGTSPLHELLVCVWQD